MGQWQEATRPASSSIAKKKKFLELSLQGKKNHVESQLNACKIMFYQK